MKQSIGEIVDNLTADELLDLWWRVERVMRARSADPQLRADILRLLPRVPPEIAANIRQELDEVHPAVVLNDYWRYLIRNRPALDAFPTQASDPSSSTIKPEEEVHGSDAD